MLTFVPKLGENREILSIKLVASKPADRVYLDAILAVLSKDGRGVMLSCRERVGVTRHGGTCNIILYKISLIEDSEENTKNRNIFCNSGNYKISPDISSLEKFFSQELCGSCDDLREEKGRPKSIIIKPISLKQSIRHLFRKLKKSKKR